MSMLCASPISVLGRDCLRASLLSDTHFAEPSPTNLVSRTVLTSVSIKLPLAARIALWKNCPRSCMPSEFCAHTKWQICYKAYQGFNASIFILFKTMAKIEQ